MGGVLVTVGVWLAVQDGSANFGPSGSSLATPNLVWNFALSFPGFQASMIRGVYDITKLNGVLLVYHNLGKIEGRVLVLVDMTHTPD